MAVLTAQGISGVAIELLTRTLVLPMTVTRIPGEEFAGANGDTITVRVPQPGIVREQVTPGATITFDDVNEIPVDVTLAHLYNAKLITDEEASLQLEDFARQITRVQVATVATGAEDQIADVMDALTPDITGVTQANVAGNVLAARTMLGNANAPASDRFLAGAPDFIELLLADPNLSDVSAAGSPSALREATVGRYRGFTVVESNGLEAGTAIAYHRSGFVWGNRVPVAPKGATDSASTTAGGIGMRSILDYIPERLSEASILSTFAGAAAVYEDNSGTDSQRFVKLELEPTS
jgi:hypothetical protein